MQTRSFRTLLYPLCAAILALSGPAMAQAAQTAAAPQQASAAEVHKLQAEAQKLAMKLGAIEHKTIAGSKALQAQRQHFSEHMVKVMKTLGYDPEGDSKRLAGIKEKVLSGKLKVDEREAQIKQFRSIRQHLMQGQVAAMQDKALMKEGKALNTATMQAMKKQDPQTEKLIKRFNAISAKLRKLEASHH